MGKGEQFQEETNIHDPLNHISTILCMLGVMTLINR